MKHTIETEDYDEAIMLISGPDLFSNIKSFDEQLRMLAKSDTTLEPDAVRKLLRDHLSEINQSILFEL